jgi:hypothetical protein
MRISQWNSFLLFSANGPSQLSGNNTAVEQAEGGGSGTHDWFWRLLCTYMHYALYLYSIQVLRPKVRFFSFFLFVFSFPTLPMFLLSTLSIWNFHPFILHFDWRIFNGMYWLLFSDFWYKMFYRPTRLNSWRMKQETYVLFWPYFKILLYL